MDKAAHEAGAFHYSCWGANIKEATTEEQKRDKYNFNLSGNDGEQHDQNVAYYFSEVVIPDVIPDGVSSSTRKRNAYF